MTIQEIYKKETGFDAYYFDSTPSKKYVKWLEKREKQLRIGGVVSRKGLNYKKAFGLAMNYINESPCDPDITSEQLDAWIDLKHFIESNEKK